MPEKVIYTGHLIVNPQQLVDQIPPRLSGEGVTVHAHHVTREFRPKSGTAEISPGRRRVLHAIGEVAQDGVHAVLVQDPSGEQISTNQHPHVTIATAPGIPPSNSKEVIAAAIEGGTMTPVTPPVEIEVIEGYYNGREFKTS